MQVFFSGQIGKRSFSKALQEIEQLLDLPPNLTLYIASNERHCTTLMEGFPKPIAQQFHNLCALGKVSFSFSYKKRNIIVLYITKTNTYLKKDKQAFIGPIVQEGKLFTVDTSYLNIDSIHLF